MGDPRLEIEHQGCVAHLWLNRPRAHNAIDPDMIGELAGAIAAFESDPGVRVVVLGGRGPSFCAGADLHWMERAASFSADENLRDARAMAAMLQAIDRLSKPTVARVHGAALGGGAGLVAACDIAVASSEACFAFSEARLGLVPATIGPYVVAAIGARHARRYFLTGERFGADEARAIGLVHEIGPPETLDARIGALVSALLSCGPRAQAAGKKLVRDAVRLPSEDLLGPTARLIAELRATPEAREGMRAFLEKRKPSWDR